MDAPQPPPSPGPLPPSGSVEQPPSIKLAVRLMQVGAATSVLGIVLAFLSQDTVRDQVIEDDASLSSSEVDTAVAFWLGFTVVMGLVAVGLWLWMASANGQGKSWARTTATVLGGLNVLSTLVGLGMGQSPGPAIVLAVVGLALAVVILIFLYRPDSNQYFDRMSRSGY